MLMQRSHVSTDRARTAARCAVIAVGATLVSAIALSSAEAAAPAHGTVTGNGVNVRNAPSLSGAVVGTKNKGDRVAIYCSHKDMANIVWDEIQVSAPQWIAASYVHVDSGVVPPCDGLGGPGSGVTEPITTPNGGTIIAVGPIITFNNQGHGNNAAATRPSN